MGSHRNGIGHPRSRRLGWHLAACLVLAVCQAARSDEVTVNGVPYTKVYVVEFADDQIVFRVGPRLLRKPLASVDKIKILEEPELTAAEESASRGEVEKAKTLYAQASAAARRPWVAVLAGKRMKALQAKAPPPPPPGSVRKPATDHEPDRSSESADAVLSSLESFTKFCESAPADEGAAWRQQMRACIGKTVRWSVPLRRSDLSDDRKTWRRRLSDRVWLAGRIAALNFGTDDHGLIDSVQLTGRIANVLVHTGKSYQPLTSVTRLGAGAIGVEIADLTFTVQSVKTQPPAGNLNGLWYGHYNVSPRDDYSFYLLISVSPQGRVEGMTTWASPGDPENPDAIYEPYRQVEVVGSASGNRLAVQLTDKARAAQKPKTAKSLPMPFILEGVVSGHEIAGTYQDPFFQTRNSFTLAQAQLHSRVEVNLAVTVRMRDPMFYEIRGLLKSIEPGGALLLECPGEKDGRPRLLEIPAENWWKIFLGNEAEYERVNPEMPVGTVNSRLKTAVMPDDFNFCILKCSTFKPGKTEPTFRFATGLKIVYRGGKWKSACYPSPQSIVAEWRRRGDKQALQVPYTWTPQYAAKVASRARLLHRHPILGNIALAVKDYNDPTKSTVLGYDKTIVRFAVSGVKKFSELMQDAAENAPPDSGTSIRVNKSAPAPAGQKKPPYYYVTGTIIGKKTRRPIKGLLITLLLDPLNFTSKAWTDVNGKFKLRVGSDAGMLPGLSPSIGVYLEHRKQLYSGSIDRDLDIQFELEGR